MATRSSDSRLQILNETPGEQHLHIPGSRLPTYNQVLLCYIAHRDKLRLEESSKMQPVKKLAIKSTINEISLHYNKANIRTGQIHTFFLKFYFFTLFLWPNFV